MGSWEQWGWSVQTHERIITWCLHDHEEGIPIPNLEKYDKQQYNQQYNQHSNEVWQVYFDGSRRKVGYGGGAMEISPEGKRYYSTFRFSFSCTNNTRKYESLAHALEWARKKNVKCLQLFGVIIQEHWEGGWISVLLVMTVLNLLIINSLIVNKIKVHTPNNT